jgi:hypothetical protein
LKDYNVLIRAKLDVSGIDKDIAEIQKKINSSVANVKVNRTTSSKIPKEIQKGLDDAKFKISPTFDKDKIDRVMKEIQAKAGTWQETKVRSGFDENGLQQAVNATVKWKDAAGNTYSEFVKLNDGIKATVTTTEKAADAQRNMATEMGAVIRRTLESAATLGLMYGALNQLRQGVSYIKDLDKELTNVQVVTGMSEESVQSLGMEYNTLAKEMGASTLEIAKGNLEFLRQGKSAEESAQLVKSSMMLSKLGNLEAAQSTEYLTSTLNGFKLEAESASDIVDKLIMLDNSAATSAGKNFARTNR